MKNILFGIESSCDDLSGCIYNIDTNKVICLKTITQSNHKLSGGIIPENASLQHLNDIRSLFEDIFSLNNLLINDINYFCATQGPGLAGSLTIGFSFTKALALGFNKPFIPINHLEGHIYSAFIGKKLETPYLCLSASGGHTALYYVKNNKEYNCIGITKDDAAGECADKVARMLGLPFPGGAILEQYAQKVSFYDYYKFPRLNFSGMDFSFSGLKTAILYFLSDNKYYDLKKKLIIKENLTDEIISKVASSFFCALKDILINRLEYSLIKYPEVKSVSFVGGVSCNNFLRDEIEKKMKDKNKKFIPCEKIYSTDNAAMICYRASLIFNDPSYRDKKYTSDIQ
jgi:N6-L-threonylcarbamoyladenine synthase